MSRQDHYNNEDDADRNVRRKKDELNEAERHLKEMKWITVILQERDEALVKLQKALAHYLTQAGYVLDVPTPKEIDSSGSE